MPPVPPPPAPPMPPVPPPAVPPPLELDMPPSPPSPLLEDDPPGFCDAGSLPQDAARAARSNPIEHTAACLVSIIRRLAVRAIRHVSEQRFFLENKFIFRGRRRLPQVPDRRSTSGATATRAATVPHGIVFELPREVTVVEGRFIRWRCAKLHGDATYERSEFPPSRLFIAYRDPCRCFPNQAMGRTDS